MSTTLGEAIENLREAHKRDLIENDRYLVILMEKSDKGKFVTSSAVVDTQKEVKAVIGDNKSWLVYGKYDFKKDPHVGILMVLAEDTNTLHLSVKIDCPDVPVSVESAVFDTGASHSIIKVTKAKKDELEKAWCR